MTDTYEVILLCMSVFLTSISHKKNEYLSLVLSYCLPTLFPPKLWNLSYHEERYLLMFLVTEICALRYQLLCHKHFQFAENFKSLVAMFSFQCLKNVIFSVSPFQITVGCKLFQGFFSCEIIHHVNLLLGPLSYTVILMSTDILDTMKGPD